MKNIDRLARDITKNGPDGILIHTIPKTNNWIVARKIELNKWLLTLMNPMGNVTFNLGIVSDQQHFELWAELLQAKIENKASQILLKQELKDKINNFKKRYEEIQIFKNCLKVETNKNYKICHQGSKEESESDDCIFETKTKKMHNMRKTIKKRKTYKKLK